MKTYRVTSTIAVQDRAAGQGRAASRCRDVADPVVDGVLVRYPTLLYEMALHADLGHHRSDHPGVVGLHAADGHRRVGVGCERVRDDVFELPQLVAAERQPGIAVLALGVDLDLAARDARPAD